MEIGEITDNSNTGIFGEFRSKIDGERLEIGEAAKGAAEVITTIDGGNVLRYKVEISKLDKNAKNNRNMIVKCTDAALVAKAGGFVQGMSGSPIVQNGKLVGVLTHVFVNTPLQGYAIFAWNMVK
jgi:stage IV sporulation protein B